MVGGDILWEMMVGCLEDGPKWCSILVSTTEVRTTLLFYIYGSWVKVREWKLEIQSRFSPQPPFSCSPIISDRNIWRSPAAQIHF